MSDAAAGRPAILSLQGLHRWHRTQELPRYAARLRVLARGGSVKAASPQRFGCFSAWRRPGKDCICPRAA